MPNGESATTLPAVSAVFGIAPWSHRLFRKVSASRPGTAAKPVRVARAPPAYQAAVEPFDCAPFALAMPLCSSRVLPSAAVDVMSTATARATVWTRGAAARVSVTRL